MTNKKHISISQIGTYTTCSYKWFVSYERGIRVKRSDVSPSTLGTVFHIGMAAAVTKFYEVQDQDWSHDIAYLNNMLSDYASDAIDEWNEENRPKERKALTVVDETDVIHVEDQDFYTRWLGMVEGAKRLVSRTIDHIDFYHSYRVVSFDNNPLIEFWLEQDIPETDYVFAGIVDMVAHNLKTGMIEVVDWKVRGKFASLESEQLSMQLGLYQHVLREQYGIDAVAGVVYQVRNVYPQIPVLNKNGTMSRQKINTDWLTYRDTLITHGLNPDEYIDEMQPKLADGEFWRPLTVVRLKTVTQRLWDNMVEHAYNISQQTVFPRAFGYACRSCPFADLCNAELYDHDTQSLFEDRYVYAEWSTEDDEDE